MPGHPVYERIRAEVEAERRAYENDPERIREVRASIDRKIEGIRRQVEWEKQQAKAGAGESPSIAGE